MRILHVITRLIVGGAQENTIASVLGLQKKPGLEVGLISGPTAGSEGSLEPAYRAAAFVPPAPDRPLVPLTIIPELVRPVRPWKDRTALRRLEAIFRETRPDVVHTHSGKAGILGRLAAARAGVPVIIHTVHGPSFGNFQGPLKNWIYRTAERRAGKVTTHFVTVADAMTRQYLEAGIGTAGQYTKIFSGFDLKPFLSAENDLQRRARLGLAPGDLVVGKIARLFELKGHDDLFAAAPDLVRECPNIKFLFVGGGPWQERFEQRARALGLQRHFVFTGVVRPEEVPALLGIMDIVVHLSRREGLPRALSQALAAGKPVVAFDCDGAGEVCINDETGFLLAPGDIRGLKARVLRLTGDPASRDRFGTRGREFVRGHFAVEQMVDQLHALYLKLGHRSGGSAERR